MKFNFPEVVPVVSDTHQSIRIDGVAFAPLAYMSHFGTPALYRAVGGVGIHLYCLPIFLGDRGTNTFSGIGPFRSGTWQDEDRFELAPFLQEATELLHADPEGWLMIRLNLDAPTWWEAAHPEGCCLLDDGTTLRQSFASATWRKATAVAIRAVLHHLQKSEIASRIIGIHLAAGRTSEWFYHFQPDQGFVDNNRERRTAFRHWLEATYEGNVDALRTAWRDPAVEFGTAVPADIRGIDRTESWRDPDVERPALDTFQFNACAMADAIAEFCRVVKDATGRQLLTAAFFGYHVYVADPRYGHGALARLLTCPDLDALASPNVYNRVPGEDWPPMVAVDSVRRHGKLWFAENDTRTCCTTLLKDVRPSICPPGQYESKLWQGPPDIETSVHLLWKNAARMLACGYGGWWFDMWGGWFDHPLLWDVLRRVQEIATEYPALDLPAMRPEICVVADETVCHYDRSFGALAGKLFNNRYTWGRSGAPYEIILPSDLPHLPDNAYRFLWLLGGIEHADRMLHEARRVCATILHIDPRGSRVWHRHSATPENDTAAQRWSPETLAPLLADAGVHRYLETSDVLYAGRGWIGIHAVESGEKKLKLPFRARIIDVIGKRELARNSDSICITMNQHDTVLLRTEPPLPIEMCPTKLPTGWLGRMP